MSEEPRAVLVTGASGFIAMHVIKRLLEGGHRVRGTVRSQERADQVRQAMVGQVTDDALDRLEFATVDLMSDDGWADAVRGCRYVHHLASPLPNKPPEHEDDLIVPARDGALRALRASAEAGIDRVIMTSSVAAVLYGHDRDGSRTYDESDWTVVDSKYTGGYEKSKTLAERAAWDFMEMQGGAMELVTINPGLVLGPSLSAHTSTSVEVVRKLMAREMPGVPDIGYAVVDVRDVADAHVSAMTTAEAAGKRFIVAIEHASFRDIAAILAEELGPRGYKIPRMKVPGFMIRVAGLWDKTARLGIQEIGKRQDLSRQRATDILGWNPRGLREMVVATAESMIEHGVVPKSRAAN